MKNVDFFTGVVFIVLASCFITGTAEAKNKQIIVDSGDTWKYSDKFILGWYKKDFNDLFWRAGETPFDDQSVSGNCNFGGNGTDWPLFSTMYLRKKFKLSKKGGVYIKFAIDNDATIYIDGKQIANINSEGCAYKWNYGISINSLKSGNHVIAAKITDRGAENGFDMMVSKAGSNFRLKFPLENQNAYSATITSVFDHSASVPYRSNGVVTAYTGEQGRKEYGSDKVDGMSLYGFKNKNGASFIVNGHYTGGGWSKYLYYDGHPGYDYSTGGKNLPVLAAAGGIARRGDKLGTVCIDHDDGEGTKKNGYRTCYLHLVNSSRIADKKRVKAGDDIGQAGGTGGYPIHLHFEVYYNNSPVDPYGWQGGGADPYSRAKNITLWN